MQQLQRSFTDRDNTKIIQAVKNNGEYWKEKFKYCETFYVHYIVKWRISISIIDIFANYKFTFLKSIYFISWNIYALNFLKCRNGFVKFI